MLPRSRTLGIALVMLAFASASVGCKSKKNSWPRSAGVNNKISDKPKGESLGQDRDESSEVENSSESQKPDKPKTDDEITID